MGQNESDNGWKAKRGKSVSQLDGKTATNQCGACFKSCSNKFCYTPGDCVVSKDFCFVSFWSYTISLLTVHLKKYPSFLPPFSFYLNDGIFLLIAIIMTLLCLMESMSGIQGWWRTEKWLGFYDFFKRFVFTGIGLRAYRPMRWYDERWGDTWHVLDLP